MVGDDFAAFTYMESAKPYEALQIPSYKAIQMVNETMRRFESGLVATASVYAPGFAKIRVPTTPLGPSTEAGIQGIRLVLQNKISQRRESIHADSYQPWIITSIREEAQRAAVMEGPVLVREN